MLSRNDIEAVYKVCLEQCVLLSDGGDVIITSSNSIGDLAAS